MPDEIHRDVQKDKFRYILLDEFEIRVPTEVGNIVYRSGDEVINTDDPMPAGEKQVGQVRAQETGSPGNYTAWRLRTRGRSV